MDMVCFRLTRDTAEMCEGVALRDLDDARARALMGLLDIEWKDPIVTHQISLPEARRRLFYAVNTWDSRWHKFARSYRVKGWGPNGKPLDTRVRVTSEQLRADLDRYENLIRRAIQVRATEIVWM